MAIFERIGVDGRPFVPIAQETVDLLESITPVEKAMAVPYMVIWQIDPTTGKPIHSDDYGNPTSPLSLQTVVPPAFGAPVDVRFRERPPVSIRRMSAKTQNPRDLITYRQIELQFMVHRPDVIFGEADPTIDSFVSMITPGSVFAMRYGWRAGAGVKNGLINGEGFHNDQVRPRTNVPGNSTIRFVVTNYNFKINPDLEIEINVSAQEDGEFNSRQALIVPQTKFQIVSTLISISTVRDPYQDPPGQSITQKIQDKTKNQIYKTKRKQRSQNGLPDVVSFEDLANVFLAPALTDAYVSIGYNEPTLVLCDLNERCGEPAPQYTLQKKDTTHSAPNIGDFCMPVKEAEKILTDMLAAGKQLTLYNFMFPLMNVLNSPETWDRTKAAKDSSGAQNNTLPRLAVRSVIAGKNVTFYVYDQEREFTKFSPSDHPTRYELLGGPPTRQRVKEVCRQRSVPYISFLRGNSYIQDSSFSVVLDEKMKAIMIEDYMDRTRSQVVDAQIKTKLNTGIDPRQLLYSSSITGKISMLGNFAFDIASLVWLDFGIVRWDGPFVVREIEDIIEPGSFLTQILLYSTGDDPLGTQGRFDQQPTGIAPVAPKRTASFGPGSLKS
jgi:hypothetical protein